MTNIYCPSALFASRENGMDLVYISNEVSMYASDIAEYPSLEVSAADGQGFFLGKLKDYTLLGCITRSEQTVYDSRPTNVIHIYFLKDETLDIVYRTIAEDDKYIRFIKEADDKITLPDQLVFMENPEILSDPDLYALCLKLTQNDIAYHLHQDLMDYSNETLFYYLLKHFDLLAFHRFWRIGCHTMLEHEKNDTVVICCHKKWYDPDLYSMTDWYYDLDLPETLYSGCWDYVNAVSNHGWMAVSKERSRLYKLLEEEAH